MVTRETVRQAVERMVVVWPMLGSRDAMRQEIGEAVMAHAERLEPQDVERGMTLLIRTSRTAANDGGPAWPPGVNELVGCILSTRADRMNAAVPDEGPVVTGPRPVAGRFCKSCGEQVAYLPPDRSLACTACRAVIVLEWREGNPRIHLTPSEVADLVFDHVVVERGDSGDARRVIAELAGKLAA
jgi:hypothetical protein